MRGTPIEVVRKDINNLHVGVYPPGERIRVAAPLHLNDDALRMVVISRLGWIRRKQSEFEQQERLSQREFVSGESHYFEGRRYRLNVIEDEGRQSVRLINNTRMELRIHRSADRNTRESVLYQWYRGQLRDRLSALLEKWEPRVGIQVAEVRIKIMKTRWGTCNSEACRIWLNLELIKKSTSCLEFILVHEMVHLIESSHNEQFRGLMRRLMPQWRAHRDHLNRAPLAHAEWIY